MRPIPSTFTPGPRYTGAVIGDSLTHNNTLGVPPHLLWPTRLQIALRALGARIRMRNFAHSGNTTQDMIARAAELTRYDAPKIGFVFAGVNDPGAKSVSSITRSSATATATTSPVHNLRVGDTFTIAGAAQTDYNITGTVLTVPSTTAFTYTVANAPVTPATGTITWSTPTAQTQANIQTLANALIAGGATMIVVVSPQFLNFTSGGESTSQTKPAGAYSAVYDAGVAAVVALNVAQPGYAVFCDLWTFMKALIVGGTETLASASWHVAGTNQHLNALGQQYVANAVLASIQSQTGWLNALKVG